jgi:membrane protein
MHAPSVGARQLRRQARSLDVRQLVREVIAGYERNDVLTYASAIAFNVFFALIPLALMAFGLLGYFGLSEVYRDHVAPSLHDALSHNAYALVDSTIRRVLSSQRFFWVTLGALITVWEMSGAVRAVMGVLDNVYECDRKRSFKERYAVSIGLAVLTGALFLLAVATFMLGPLLGTGVSIARWPVTVVILLATVAAFVRWAPAEHQPAEWVSIGTLLTVVAWLGTSVVFALYVRDVASYDTVFGALSVIIIAFEYLYLAAIAFLTGAQVDAILRRRLADEEG